MTHLRKVSDAHHATKLTLLTYHKLICKNCDSNEDVDETVKRSVKEFTNGFSLGGKKPLITVQLT